MKAIWKKAFALMLAMMGVGVVFYSIAVVAMADTIMIGTAAAGACCLPVAVILFVFAYVVWTEAKE